MITVINKGAVQVGDSAEFYMVAKIHGNWDTTVVTMAITPEAYRSVEEGQSYVISGLRAVSPQPEVAHV